MSRLSPLRLQQGPLTAYLIPWERPADLAAYARALPAEAPCVWLDSARHHPVTGRWSMLGSHPWLICSAADGRVLLHTSASTRQRRAHPLEALRTLLRRYRPVQPRAHGSTLGPVARTLGLMGFLSYDLNRWIERLPEPQAADDAAPDMRWYGMRRVILIDHAEARGWLVSLVDPHAPQGLARREALAGLEAMTEALARAGAEPPADTASAGLRESWTTVLRPTSSEEAFTAMVERALEEIRAGEIFQANVSQRFTAPWPVGCSPLALYLRLRAINPSPFACYLESPDLSVVSCSPERLVRIQDGWVDTRPIAGTRPRGATPQDDAVNSLELLLSEKERAEHIMLVDLARNDLGRLARPGSVTVGELMALEAYSHVIHIVSDVSGRLRLGVDAVDTIRAVFPGGTITGCPKVRCMQILRELEPVARGLYTGSLGYLGFDGSMDLNIAIRTIVRRGGGLAFHVGAGIVADSIPSREYQETLAKASALMSALRPAGHPSHAAAA